MAHLAPDQQVGGHLGELPRKAPVLALERLPLRPATGPGRFILQARHLGQIVAREALLSSVEKGI